MTSKIASEMLSKVLEDIGVSEKIINRRKSTFAEKEAVTGLSVMLLGGKALTLQFGSQIEGTTTLGMNSDLDSLSYLTHWPVILAIEDWSVGKKNLLLLSDQQCPPQHCYLQRLREDAPEPLTNLPEFDHVKDSKERILIKNTYVSNSAERLIKKVGKRFIQHGPSVSYSDMTDYVFCFHCKKVPDVCSSWVNRARQGHWPPENIRSMARDVGIYLLSLGHPESEGESVEWRFSTSETERLLMFSLNTCQIKVYVLLKMLRKTFIKKLTDDRLSSYHLKTALLYTIERYPPDVWREDNLIQCTIYCLDTLARWLHQNFLPHFTMEGVNLLIGKLQKCELPALRSLILDMISTELQCILGIAMDAVGDRLWTLIHNGWYSNEQFTSRNKIECAIVANLADQYFGNINHSLNQYLVAANKVSFEQAYNVMKTNLSMFAAARMQTSDQIKRDGLMLFIKYLSSVIATMQASRWFRNGLLILSDETYRRFDVSLDFDLASCKLKLASVYYRMKEYHKAVAILSKIEKSFQPYVISACECRKRSKIRTTKAFNQKALASTNQNTLKSSVVFCVKFLRHEVECMPKHLIFEMYRGVCSEDISVRDPWDDTWMDMAFVDSLPYTYYLLYLTYRELGQEEARIEAVEKLGDYVHKYNGYGHIETVCNLVGHCFELEGLFDQALEWYFESLHALPRNNAAMWHILLLLHSLYHKQNLR